MILHVSGTQVPGSLPLPEYLKANVYLPPSLVENQPELCPFILRITQDFLETIGVATVLNWKTRAVNDLGYSMTMAGNARPNGKIYDVPPPQIRSAHYIIPGQCMGDSPGRHDLTTAVGPAVTSVPSPASSCHASNGVIEATLMQLQDSQEQVHVLSEKLVGAQEEIRRVKGSKHSWVCSQVQIKILSYLPMSVTLLQHPPHSKPPADVTMHLTPTIIHLHRTILRSLYPHHPDLIPPPGGQWPQILALAPLFTLLPFVTLRVNSACPIPWYRLTVTRATCTSRKVMVEMLKSSQLPISLP